MLEIIKRELFGVLFSAAFYFYLYSQGMMTFTLKDLLPFICGVAIGSLIYNGIKAYRARRLRKKLEQLEKTISEEALNAGL